MATIIIETEDLSRMMVSFCLAASYCNAPSKEAGVSLIGTSRAWPAPSLGAGPKHHRRPWR
jgi:hypothetical protein